MNRTHMNMVGPGKRHAKTLVGRERRRRDKTAATEGIAEMPDRMERWDDGVDAEIAEQRLAEIDAHPERVVRGEELRQKMRQWEESP
ncbi:hypothetical protein LCGC14_0335000 [marine sediment metagenome]|uniref:Uncharacterized protein n=1 Tax=marine sediment metagenome TaxID=412755 RepID=A0A0F9TYE8_9ZZZZ